MTPSDPALRAEEDRLLLAWRTRALATVWRHPGDWEHPATEALVEALVEGDDPRPAVRRLGAARALVGAGMDETVDDLVCLFRAVGTEPDAALVREVAVGWAHESVREPQLAVTDPLTGLRTPGYLVARMEELYDAPAARAALEHALLMLDVSVDDGRTTSRFRVGASVGAMLADVLGPGHPTAQVRTGLFVALVARSRAAVTVDVLRERIDRLALDTASGPAVAPLLRNPARLWVEQLPDGPGLCASLVESLGL